MNKSIIISICSRHLTTAAFFCLLVACALFSSCENDGEENLIVSEENINGIWELKNEEGYEEGEHYSQNVSNRYYEIDIPNYREIRKDRDTGKWEVRSTKYCSINLETHTLKIGYYEYKILQLTSNTLQWRFESETEDWWQIQTFKKVDKGVFKDLGIDFD